MLRADPAHHLIVSVHQPHFLPWLGYLNKVLHSDVFVWLDTVQYRKNYYQNRTVIRTRRGEELWLTLPVHAPFGTPIDRVTVADPKWRDRLSKTVEQNYGRAPFFSVCWPEIAKALEGASDTLTDVDFRAFNAVLRLLRAGDVRVVRAGELGVTSAEPTERLVEACRAVGGKSYIAGKGGKNYLRIEAFEEAGIGVAWQQFDPAAQPYPQTGPGFVPGLSVIDCLFNIGPDEAGRLIRAAWAP